MHVHYIEDNDNDAEVLSTLAEDDGRLKLTLSRSITGLHSQINDSDPDCLLIDVIRPDALSVEQDVELVRRYTSAPIMFITGGDPNAIRRRAVKAGAEAVLDKRKLNVDVLWQALVDARARTEQHAAPVLVMRDAAPLEAETAMGRFARPLAQMQTELSELTEHLRKAGRTVSAESAERLLDTANTLTLLAKSDLNAKTLVGLHDAFQDVSDEHIAVRFLDEPSAKDEPNANDSGLIRIDVVKDWFWHRGSADLASLAFQHLAQGVLALREGSERVAVRVERDNLGVSVAVYADQALLRDIEELLAPIDPCHSPQRAKGLSHLQMTLLLLSMPSERVSLQQIGEGQRIVFQL